MSRLDETNVRLVGDRDGLAMANYPAAARDLAVRFAGREVLELCCGIGATTVFLASVAKHVVAVDIKAARLGYAAQNARALGIGHRVEFIEGDVLDASLLERFRGRAVFADPAFNPRGYSTDYHTEDIRRTQPPTDVLARTVLSVCSSDLALRVAARVPTEGLFDLGASEVEVFTLEGVSKFQCAFFGTLARATGVVLSDAPLR